MQDKIAHLHLFILSMLSVNLYSSYISHGSKSNNTHITNYRLAIVINLHWSSSSAIGSLTYKCIVHNPIGAPLITITLGYTVHMYTHM